LANGPKSDEANQGDAATMTRRRKAAEKEKSSKEKRAGRRSVKNDGSKMKSAQCEKSQA
jgi:hypothetical protein